AVLGGDDAEVLAPRLGALAGAPGHGRLQLVRGAQPPVPQLEADRHGGRVLDAVAAPGGPDARLHRPQRLAVGVPRLEPGLDEPPPDLGELLDAGAEHVDPLPSGDLGVEAEVAGDLPDDDELVGGDLPAGDARHHRVRPVPLQVGEEVVVGVLERGLRALEDVAAAEARQDGRHGGLADGAAAAPAVLLDELRAAGDPLGAADLEQLGAALVEVLAQGGADLDARGGQLGVQEPLHQRDAAAAAGPGPGAVLDGGEVGEGVLADGAADGVGGDVVAGADDGRAGQVAAGGLGAAEQHLLGRARQGPPDMGAQGRVGPGGGDEDAAEEGAGVVADDELLVHAGDGVGVGDAERAVPRVRERVAEARDVHAHELQLGRGVGALEHGGARVRQQPVGDDLGHREARAHEAVHRPADEGALPDRPHGGVPGAAGGVHDDAAALADGQAAAAGQLVAGPDAGGEDHDLGVDGRAVPQDDPPDRAVV